MFSISVTLSIYLVLAANIAGILLSFRRPLRENLRMLGACILITMFTLFCRLFLRDAAALFNILPGALYLPSLYFIHKGSISQKVFITFTVLSITYLIFLTVSLIPFDYPWLRLLLLIAALSAYVALMVWKGHHFVKQLFYSANRKAWKWYAFYLAMFYFVLMRLYGLEIIVPAEKEALPFFYILPFFALFGLVLFFTSLIHAQQKVSADYELKLVQVALHAGQDHYIQLTDVLNRTRILRHDYKHQLAALETLLKQGKQEKAQEHLQQLSEAHDREVVLSYCSNAVLDALILHYAHRIQEADIVFSFRGALPDEIDIADYELCIVIGNLLENCLDACLRLPASQKKSIEMKTQLTKNYLVIRVRNTFDGKVILNKDGFSSMKQDGGLGINSIRAVVEKYKGSFETEWNHDTFTSYILLDYDI